MLTGDTVVYTFSLMKETNNTFRLRLRVMQHMMAAPSRFPDRSTNPRYWNKWEFEWDGGTVQVFHQRWCRGRRHGQTNYIRVTKNHERLLVRSLRKLADWLTDERAKNLPP
jgi:hypothetical protein